MLQCFREGRYKCLITTDVASRGLDIPEVDLVIQCNPPKDVDSYIHRSGRTGRAGRNGTCVCFYKPQEEFAIHQVEIKAVSISGKLIVFNISFSLSVDVPDSGSDSDLDSEFIYSATYHTIAVFNYIKFQTNGPRRPPLRQNNVAGMGTTWMRYLYVHVYIIWIW